MKLRNLAFFTAAILPLAAQDPSSPLLWIYREQIKPGKVAAYLRLEEGAARTCARLNCPNPYFAITSLTGPDEAWWINGFDSPETMEKVWHDYGANQEIARELNAVAESKGDLAFPGSNLMARFRPDMSFYATPISLRLISITILQVRPAHLSTFRDSRIRFKAIMERAGRPQWTYQVVSGAEETTFIVMTPARSMKEILATPAFDDPSDIIVTSETRLYTVAPSLSMPAQSWIDADPDFWKRP